MQTLLSQLRVKDVTIFELLDGAFSFDTFLFFPRLGAYLGREAGLSEKDGRDLGLLSELVYLYARLHASVEEKGEGDAAKRVLLGDLFLGRFYETLSAQGKERCLPVYIDFMRQFNAGAIDALNGKAPDTGGYRALLVRKTAEAAALLAGLDAAGQERLTALAEREAPRLHGGDDDAPVRSLRQLEERLAAEQI